jgi:hypothetical protein
MANRFSKAAKDAAEMTNKQLADELAAVTRLSREELNELLPTKNDKEKFALLMQQVEADTAMDEKIAFLGENLKTIGGVVFKVLKAFV